MEKAVIVLNLLLGNGSIVFVYACVDPQKTICLVGFGLVMVMGKGGKGAKMGHVLRLRLRF